MNDKFNIINNSIINECDIIEIINNLLYYNIYGFILICIK